MKDKDNSTIAEVIDVLRQKADQKEELDKLNTEYLSIKNDPNRWMKKNKNFENEVEALRTQVNVIQESIQKIENKKKKIEDMIRDIEGTKQVADMSKLDAAETDKLKVTAVRHRYSFKLRRSFWSNTKR